MATEVYERIQAQRREIAGKVLAAAEDKLLANVLDASELEYIQQLFSAQEPDDGSAAEDELHKRL